MKSSFRFGQILFAATVLLSGASATMAQVPQLLNYQGRIAVNGTNFTGTGQFKFALVDGGTNLTFNTFWSNDGTSNAGGQPATSVPLPVTKGLYSVLLGDTTLSNMTALPATVFANPDVRLRVWFSDGTTGFQQLTPDQRLAAVGYAIMAGTVPDGSITKAKIAVGAVGSSQLAPNLTIPGTLTVSNLVINGSAVMNSSSNYQIPSGTNIQTYAGGSYFITYSSGNIILPSIANVGDTIRLIIASGNTELDFNILQNPGQRIVAWNTLYYDAPMVSSADGSRLLLNAAQGFFISTNFAASWTVEPPLEPLPTPYYSVFQMSGDGSHIFAGAESLYYQGSYSYIVVSSDYGQSWILNTNIAANRYDFRAIACSTNGVKAVALAVGGSIFTSTDAGSNWTLQTSAPTNVAYWTSAASSADGTKLVAVDNGNGAGGGIYTSGDSGTTWTLQTNAPTNDYWTSVASSTDGTKLVALSAWDGIYTSGDSGTTWTQQTSAPTDASWNSVASSADGTKLVAGASSGEGIYTSVDSGSTWILQTNGLLSYYHNCFAVASSADGLKLSAIVESQLYTSVDSGNTWSPCSTIPSSYQAMIALTSLGSSGGVTFRDLINHELTLVYLGDGIFAIGDGNAFNNEFHFH